MKATFSPTGQLLLQKPFPSVKFNSFLKIAILQCLLVFLGTNAMGQCSISDIDFEFIEWCNNPDPDDWQDDYYVVNIKVVFSGTLPQGGKLVLMGDADDEVLVSQITSSTQYTFNGVEIPTGRDRYHREINIGAKFTNSNGTTACELPVHLLVDSNNDQINSPTQCSVCSCPEGACGQSSNPSCWPTETSDCDLSINYAPNADAPELTPIRYIQVVLHIFQKEDPDHVGANPRVIHPTDPENYTVDDIPVLKSWFDDPEYGLNAFYSNLVDDPDDGSDWMKDARIRFVFKGEENVDVFFHPNNQAWGRGYNSTTCGKNTGGGGDLFTTYIDPLDDVSKNAFHVYLTGGTWLPDGSGDPAIPDDNDCYNLTGGGYTTGMTSCPSYPTATITGNYCTYVAGNYPEIFDPLPHPWYSDCAAAYSGNDASMGGQIVGELFHLFTIDHISPIQGHIQGGDFCDDTPVKSYYNKMDCEGSRNALTRCQIGRIHHFFYEEHPLLERFKIGEDEYALTPPADYYCTIAEPDLVVPDGADVLWAYPRQVRSNVLIESGGRLTIKCDVGFPEDARITVEKEGQLIIDGARLYNNCDGDYWDGIVVEGQSDLPQQYDPVNQTYHQGFLDIRTGSTIEKARTAVECQVPGSSYQTGGIVKATGATFLNCQNRFVHIRDFQNTTLSNGQPTGSTCSFSQCTFTIDDDYTGSFVSYFYDMVRLKNVDGIRFIGCNFINDIPTSSTTYADDRKFGIYSVNAGFSVKGTCNSTSLPCTSYTNGVFRGFNRAIYSGIKGSARTVSVSNTDFTDNLVGIDLSSVNNAYIVSNNFHVGSNQPPTTPQAGSWPSNRGIMLFNCTGYKVENNTLDLFTGTGTTNPVGILVNGSKSLPNEVYRNYLSDLETGNLSNGRNRNPSPFIIQGLQYLCNTNSGNAEFDFAVPTETGSNEYGVRGQQGSSSLAAGNTFSSAPSVDSEIHFHNKQNNITYFYYNQTGQVPTNVTPFKVFPVSANSFSCPSKLPSGKEEGLLSSTERQQFHQDFGNTSSTVETKTYAADMLVRHFLIDTTQTHLDSVRDILVQKNDLASSFGIVDAWLQENNADSAQQVLADISSQFTLTGESLKEYNYFDTLKTLQINALQSEIDDDTLVAYNEAILERIAEAGNYHASGQAQILLNSVNGFTYTPDVILPSSGGLGIMAPPQGNVAVYDELTGPMVEAQPNPARSQTDFRYRLPEDIEQGQITVTDLMVARWPCWMWRETSEMSSGISKP